MEARETIRKIAKLPPEAQAILLDLIDSLSRRYDGSKSVAKKPGTQMKNLRSDPFVGMWRDRDDMADAPVYVRELRRTGWKRNSSLQ